MGIVSLIALAAGIGFFISLRHKINQLAEEEKDRDVSWMLRWGARFSALIAVLGIVGMVDSYIYKFPNVFQPPEAELPAKSEAADMEVPDIKPADKPDPMKDAKAEHRKDLDEFEQQNSRAEAR